MKIRHLSQIVLIVMMLFIILPVSAAGDPPDVTNPGNQTSNEGDTISLQIEATDPESEALTFSEDLALSQLPYGLVLNSSGLISGTIDYDAEGIFTVVIIVQDSDPPVESSSITFQWEVLNTNRPPVIEQTATELGPFDEGEIDVTVLFPGNVSDPDGGDFTYSTTSVLPPDLILDTFDGNLEGDLTYQSAGEYEITIIVSDDGTPALTDSITYTLTINNVNRPPTITVVPEDQIFDEGTSSINLVVTASDPDNDTLIYQALGLPQGLSIDPNNGGISGSLDFDVQGEYIVTIRVVELGTDELYDDTAQFIITVNQVNRNPVMDNPPSGTVNNDEGDIIDLDFSATDDLGETLTYSTTDTLPNGVSLNPNTGVISGKLSFDSANTYNITVTVTDDGDPALTDTASFTWEIADVPSPPTITTIVEDATYDEGDTITIDFEATDPESTPLVWSASGLPPGLNIDEDTGVLTGSIGYDAVSTGGAPVEYDVIITVINNDGAGVADNLAFTWTVNDVNRPPTVATPGTQNSAENIAVNLNLFSGAADPDGNDITFSSTTLPPGLSINSDTGVITGTIPFTAVTSAMTTLNYEVVVTLTDDGSPAAMIDVVFPWTVTNTNRPPVIGDPFPTNQTHNEGININLPALVSTDADGDSVTYSATGLPPDLTINPTTGAITGLLSFSASVGSPYTVVVTATDNGTPTTQSSDRSFTWTVNDVTPQPIITPINNSSVEEGQNVNIQVQATHPNSGSVTLTYSATGLPAGAAINPNTGLISGVIGFDVITTPGGSQGFNVVVTVSDGTEAPTEAFTLTVNDTNRSPQITQTIPDQTNLEGDPVNLSVIAASDPDGNSLTFEAFNLPEGLSISASTGVISGTISPVAADNSPYSVTIRVQDNGTPQLAAQDDFVWTVNPNNEAPLLASIENQFNSVGDTVSLQIEANDPDNDPLTYSALGLPTGLTINASTGLITGTLTQEGVRTVTITVTDNGSPALNDEQDFFWSVITANANPTVTNPGTQRSGEGEIIALQIVATDADGDTLTFSATGLPSGLTINPQTGLIGGTIAIGASTGSPYNVSIMVTDGNGGSTTTLIQWIVNDISDPNPANLAAEVKPYVVEFDWTHQAVAGASRVPSDWYQVLVQRDGATVFDQWYAASEICSGINCTVAPTSFVVANGQHLWWVTGYTVGTGETVTSDLNGAPFSVNYPIPAHVTQFGVTGTEDLRPTFTWSISGGAQNVSYFYLYVVPTVNPGLTLVSQWLYRGDVCDDSTLRCEWELPYALFADTEYQAYVLSLGPAGYSVGGVDGFAGPFVFSLGTSSGGAPPVPNPYGIDINQGRITINFEYDPIAEWYQVWVGTDTFQTVHLGWYEKNKDFPCVGAVCSLTPDANPLNGSHQVWMRSWSSTGGFSVGGTDGWSGPDFFALNFSAPQAIIAPITATYSDSGRPVFGFDGVEGATWYNIWVGTDTFQTLHYSWYLAEDAGCMNAERCQLAPYIILPNGGPYLAYIRSWGPGGFSTGGELGWTASQNFATNGAPLADPVPPFNVAISASNPDYTWPQPEDASWYAVWIGNVGPLSTAHFNYYGAYELGCFEANTCSLDVYSLDIPIGTYQLWVQAYSSTGISSWVQGSVTISP